ACPLLLFFLSYSFFHCSARHRPLHPFPTRRSSDLLSGTTINAWWFNPRDGTSRSIGDFAKSDGVETFTPPYGLDWVLVLDDISRSEEHTSELQSRENLVCRLLLEKKK